MCSAALAVEFNRSLADGEGPMASICVKWVWTVISVGPAYATSLMKCRGSSRSSRYSHTGVFLGSLRQQKAAPRGGRGNGGKILAFYHLLAYSEAAGFRALRRCFPSSACSSATPGGSLQAAFDINIHRLLCVFSVFSHFLSSLARQQHKNRSIVPGTLTPF